MISPGTISSDFIFLISPSLNTFAIGLLIFFNASRASSALLSWESQITAFTNTIKSISHHSKSSPKFHSQILIQADTKAAMINTIIIGSSNCFINLKNRLFFHSSFNSFFPYSFKRFSASFKDSQFSLLFISL
jgi:hypothetical protein